MNIKLIYSNLDPVGNVIKKLGYGFEEINEDVINFTYEKGDAIVIFSRHQSKKGIPSLTVHYPGNPTHETMGGEPKKLGIAYPKLLTSIFREIKKLNIDIEKTLEATHHGPTHQRIPIIFVEVGSEMKYWTNEKIVKMVVDSTIKAIDNVNEIYCKDFIVGFGGTHYPKPFNNLADENCIGHIISKHYIDKIDDEIILQAVKNSINSINKIVLDSLNASQREHVMRVLRNLNISIEFR
ncbi:MAG: D-aminoacyl-tRNA deacylase [Saccharolobus sp.]